MAVSVCLPLPHNGQYQDQWDYVLSNFNPDTVFVIGDEKNAPTTNVFAKLKATYVKDASELPDTKLVVLAPDNGRYIVGNEDLKDFVHPEDVIYLFGGDVEWLWPEQLGDRVPDHLVYIDTNTHDDMWSWVAYAVVAWDRRMKSG